MAFTQAPRNFARFGLGYGAVTAPVRLLMVFAWLGLTSCARENSERCSALCNKEAECAEAAQGESAFDERECVNACAALERDSETAALVDKHNDCVSNAGDNCAAIRECR